MTAPKSRQLTPLTCELGEHVANGSIFRWEGAMWCGPCIRADCLAKGVPAPGWLGP